MLTTEEIIERNNRVKNFFNQFIDVEIYGDINNPAVIFDNKKILNCYVHNFKLNFTDKPKDGETLFSIRLSDNKFTMTEQQKELFFTWLKQTNQRNCYRINVVGTNLFLSGYTFKDKNPETEIKFPVFSEINYKYYFCKEFPLKIIEQYKSKKLNLQLL